MEPVQHGAQRVVLGSATIFRSIGQCEVILILTTVQVMKKPATKLEKKAVRASFLAQPVASTTLPFEIS